MWIIGIAFPLVMMQDAFGSADVYTVDGYVNIVRAALLFGGNLSTGTARNCSKLTPRPRERGT
jgi:hypothetical protein